MDEIYYVSSVVYFEMNNDFDLINPTPYHNIYVYIYIYANEYAHVLLLLTSGVTAYVSNTRKYALKLNREYSYVYMNVSLALTYVEHSWRLNITDLNTL